MKNAQIEFWRFVFAINMVVYHVLGHIFGIKTGGYIGVEFFAILSGYFLALSHAKSDKAIIPFIRKRFFSLWPMYLAAYFISIVLHGIQTNMTGAEIVYQVYRSFPEMFMLKIHTSINGVAWFMTAMLISGILLWICLTIDPERKWISGFLLICALFIYSAFLQTHGNIHYTKSRSITSIYYDGFWRVFADMAIGVFGFSWVQNEKCILKDKTYQIVLCVIGNLGFAIVFLVSLFKNWGFSDFWYIFIIWCALVCLMIPDKIVTNENRIAKIVCYLGGLTYPIYLLHEAVYETFNILGSSYPPPLAAL